MQFRRTPQTIDVLQRLDALRLLQRSKASERFIKKEKRKGSRRKRWSREQTRWLSNFGGRASGDKTASGASKMRKKIWKFTKESKYYFSKANVSNINPVHFYYPQIHHRLLFCIYQIEKKNQTSSNIWSADNQTKEVKGNVADLISGGLNEAYHKAKKKKK